MHLTRVRSKNTGAVNVLFIAQVFCAIEVEQRRNRYGNMHENQGEEDGNTRWDAKGAG